MNPFILNFFHFLTFLYYEMMILTQKLILCLFILPFKNESFSISGINIPGMLFLKKNGFINCNFLYLISNNVNKGFFI